MENDSIKEIAVVGDGTVFLLCLLAFRLKLAPYGVVVRGYELSGPEAQGVVHIGRGMENLFSSLALDTPRVLAQCEAVMVLGEKYQFSSHSWIHSYGEYGIDGQTDRLWRALLAAQKEMKDIFGDARALSLSTLAIQTEKFAVPSKGAPFSNQLLDFGAVLSRRKLDAYFRRLLSRANVSISKLPLEKGSNVNSLKAVKGAFDLPEADFWVDCISQSNAVNNHTVSKNHVMSVEWLIHEDNSAKVPSPVIQHKKMSSGWLSVLKSQYCTSYRLVTGESRDEDEVKVDFPVSDANEISRRMIEDCTEHTPWEGNTLKITSLISPLSPAGDDLVESVTALFLFIENLPFKSNLGPAKKLFTSQWKAYSEEFLDYISALNGLAEGSMEVNRSVARDRIACFSVTGKIVPLETDAFTKSDWIELMVMNGIRPKNTSFYSGESELNAASTLIASTKAKLNKLCAGMPLHQQFIDAMKLHAGE